MTKHSNSDKNKKQTNKDQEEILQDQYEFGLNEEVRKELEEKEDSHKEPDDIADADDIVIDED